MAKADVLKKAQDYGLEVDESMTVATLQSMIDEYEEQNPPAPPPPVKKATHYERWKVEIKNGQAEKLKLVKACVKITEKEAETLNTGVLNGPENRVAEMYFLPE